MSEKLQVVVVGTSLGEGSDFVVGTAVAIARAAGAQLVLVHANELAALPVGLEVGAGFAGGAEQLAWGDEESTRQLERLAIGSDILRAREVRLGSPHRILMDVVGEHRAGLVVLGATDSGPFAAELLGSTAERVLRKSTCPVWVVRGGGISIPPREVVAAVDLSPIADQVFQRGLELLGELRSRGRVRAVHALGFVDAAGIRHRTGVSIDDVMRQSATALDAFVRRHESSAGGFEVETSLRSGEARVEILRELAEHPADLLLLGTHGRGGWDRLILGSVAATLARQAPCSVLMVPPKG